MAAVRLPTAERRRDPRFVLPGTARLGTERHPSALDGALIDVSAGGLRVRLGRLPDELAPGTAVDVEVTVTDASDPSRPPVIHLRGRGQVVRLLRLEEGPGEVALRLEGPLGFRDYFGHLRVF